MLLAAMGIEMASRRISEGQETTMTSIFINYTPQCRASKRRHVAKSTQVSSSAVSRTSLKEIQLAPNSPQGFALPIKIEVAQELSE